MRIKLIGVSFIVWVLSNTGLAVESISATDFTFSSSLTHEKPTTFSLSQELVPFQRIYKNVQEDNFTQRFAVDYVKWEKEKEKREIHTRTVELEALKSQEQLRQDRKDCQDGAAMFRKVPKPGELFNIDSCKYISYTPK